MCLFVDCCVCDMLWVCTFSCDRKTDCLIYDKDFVRVNIGVCVCCEIELCK